jgi:hypothetical protein
MARDEMVWVEREVLRSIARNLERCAVSVETAPLGIASLFVVPVPVVLRNLREVLVGYAEGSDS